MGDRGNLSAREEEIFSAMEAEFTREQTSVRYGGLRALDRTWVWAIVLVVGLALTVSGIGAGGVVGPILGVVGFGVALLGLLRGWETLKRLR